MTRQSAIRESAAAWDEARRLLRESAELRLRQAGRLLELLPADPEAARAAARLFREASRLRTERVSDSRRSERRP